VYPGQGAGGMTGADVQALRARIGDLRRELQDAAERRNSIAERLKEADVAARAGYEARLKATDDRILKIENELTRSVEQLAAAPPAAWTEIAQREPDPNIILERISNDIVPIVGILSLFVFMPFTIAISRFFWRRASAPPRAAAVDQGTVQRLEQLQQAVDTIALEVERISEGQRFVTRILNDRALGSGPAEPVRSAQRSASPVERG